MKNLFMDLDDTFLNTEKYIREILKNSNLSVKASCVYTLRAIPGYNIIIEKIMNNYSTIPMKKGAEDCLKLLKTEYNVVFCSRYYTLGERSAKKEFAKEMNTDIILVASEDISKKSVDMHDGVLVDDSLEALEETNASVKVQMFNPYVAKGLLFKDYLKGDYFAENLYDVIDCLLGGNIDENLRRDIYSRI